MAVTVLIVDDSAEFRTAARRLLEAEGLDVIGEAGDIASGREAVRAMRPRVVLLDVHLPDGDGIEAAASLMAESAGCDVALVSSRDAVTYGARLASSPAVGFIPKGELSPQRLLRLLGEGP